MSDSPAARRLSRVDNAWLRMDSDLNRMMIVGVWLLTPAVPLVRLQQRVTERLLRYARFRQVAVADAVGARWVDDPRFDLDHHVRLQPLKRRRGESERAALRALCGRLAMQPLPPDRPLWQLHLVPDYEDGSALVVRIHHAVGDGIALISVMNAITDDGPAPPIPPRPAAAAEPDDQAAEADWLAEAVLKPLTALTVRAIGWSGEGVARVLDGLVHPQQGLNDSLETARHGVQILADAAALALMPDDATTRLKGLPAGRKRVAWSEPLPLAPIKAVGRVLGCSVNDVLLAGVAGAIGHWLRAQGDDPGGQEIRAMVPVNLRPLSEAWRLGNRFGLAPLTLPVGLTNPVERVYAVHARMQALKGSTQPLLAYALLALTGAVAKPVQDAVLGLFARKTTAVMTNVPGPKKPLRFCGATIRQALFWVPASGSVGVGVSVLSYAGGVQFGLITDEALCPDPQAIVDRFGPELEQLTWLALMLPWGGVTGLGAPPAAAAGAVQRAVRRDPRRRRTRQPLPPESATPVR